ncbi:protein of unknown function [Chryseobacterium sp. JV274]|nr:protein of unknown function [Chryseobacterium sp. JV274]
MLVCAMGKAQTFDLLQGDMNPYKGGAVQFYKDLNTVLIESHSEHCNNRMSEMFLAELEIEKGQAKIINKTLSDNCPTAVFVKALNEINKLKKWKKVRMYRNMFPSYSIRSIILTTLKKIILHRD